MLTFIGSDKEGRPLKRKQARRACHECRKRKKRCIHSEKDEDGTVVHSGIKGIKIPSSIEISATARASSFRPPTYEHVAESIGVCGDSLSTTSTDFQTPDVIEKDDSYREENEEDDTSFIGDLNPEGTLLNDKGSSAAGPAPDSAGAWLQRKSIYNQTSHGSRHMTSSCSKTTSLSKVVLSYLEENCLRQLPNKDNYKALRSVYLEYIHPLYPILDHDSLPNHSDDSPLQIMLKQAVCLAASAIPQAKQHLELPMESGHWTLYTPRDFASQIATSLRTSIYLGLVRNRICMLQIFSLLSLFTQFAEDRHSSAEAVASAVSYLHTIGLHLDTQEQRKDHDFVTRLFCCVWLLDRLNAAFHGRPVLMHERDFGRDLEKCFGQQNAEFQLLLRVALLLDQVIVLYRPTVNGAKTWDSGFPAFEDLIHQSGASGVRSSLLATIETLYHAVAMLTYRSKSITEVVRSSAAFARQMLSATAVTHIVATEYRGQLSLLPIVPYAVSLTLRCAYRELRLSRSTYSRERARQQLTVTCDMLRELAEIFPAAMLMVELADQTLREMDKVVSSIRRNRQQSTRQTNDCESSEYETQPEPLYRRDNLQAAMDIPITNGSLGDQTQSHSEMPWLLDGPSLGTDIDIFDYFDPDLNLDAIDAMLGDSIEASFPYLLSSPES